MLNAILNAVTKKFEDLLFDPEKTNDNIAFLNFLSTTWDELDDETKLKILKIAEEGSHHD